MEEDATTIVPVNGNMIEHQLNEVLTLANPRTRNCSSVEVETLTVAPIIQKLMKQVETRMDSLYLLNNTKIMRNDEINAQNKLYHKQTTNNKVSQ